MNNKVSGFFAYSSMPPSIPNTIDPAIKNIKSSINFNLKSWEECRISGKILIDVICREINSADIFCADLTGFNPNVMFELGYAIARKKRIWLILDTTLEESIKTFEQLRILTTVGYVHYSNSQDIINGLYSDEPWNDLDNSIYSMSIEPTLSSKEPESILYLKSRHNTEAEIRLANCVEKYKLPLTIDDPKESAVQSLVWYAQKVYTAIGVLVHLCGPSRQGAVLHNSRYSFVAGLAYGFEKPLLILAESDYVSPIDYRDIMKLYQTPRECVDRAKEWLEVISLEYSKQRSQKKEYLRATTLALELKNLKVGEYIAENEKEQLDDYFIETSSFLEALEGRHTIIVGRKGSGKTANLYAIEKRLSSDKRNLVCVIKPVSYEIESVVRLLKNYKERDEKGYMVESLWKFLIYTEIALSVMNELNSKSPGSIYPGSDEDQLVNIISENPDIIHSEFAVRLEKAVGSLFSIASQESVEGFRLAVSEKLHESVLKSLRAILGKVLKDKERVILLFDNLDKAWVRRKDLEVLTDFLLGLLRVINNIRNDFSKKDYWRKPVKLDITVFLRTDIFSYLMKIAREPDKIAYSRLLWEDPEILLRIIDERLVASRSDKMNSQNIWKNMFCTHVKNIPIRDYLVKNVLPRPRDIVYFTRAAIATAVNRAHTRVEEDDIIEAEKQYSQFVFDSIQVENNVTVPELENILFEFVGQPEVMTEKEILSLITKAGIEKERLQDAVRHLCSLSFLGMEINPDQFEFSAQEEESQKYMVLAKKLAESRNGLLRYKVNTPFHAFLEISK